MRHPVQALDDQQRARLQGLGEGLTRQRRLDVPLRLGGPALDLRRGQGFAPGRRDDVPADRTCLRERVEVPAVGRLHGLLERVDRGEEIRRRRHDAAGVERHGERAQVASLELVEERADVAGAFAESDVAAGRAHRGAIAEVEIAQAVADGGERGAGKTSRFEPGAGVDADAEVGVLAVEALEEVGERGRRGQCRYRDVALRGDRAESGRQRAGGDDDGLGPEGLRQLQRLTLRGGVGADVLDTIGQQADRPHPVADGGDLIGGEPLVQRLGHRPPEGLAAMGFDEVHDQCVSPHHRVQETQAFRPHRQLPPGETVVADQRSGPPGDALERVTGPLECGLTLSHRLRVDRAGTRAPERAGQAAGERDRANESES